MGAKSHVGVDYKGRIFGRLEARAPDPKNKKNGTHWWFMCECGKYVSMRMSNVFCGRTKSCGCLRREYLGKYRKDIQEFLDMRHAVELALSLVDRSKPEFKSALTQIDMLAKRKQS